MSATAITPAKSPNFPVELTAMQGYIVKCIIPQMWPFAISRISQTISIVGVSIVNSVSFYPIMGANPPQALLQLRDRAVRLLGDIMCMYGILDLSTQYEDRELEVIRSAWVKLSKGESIESLESLFKDAALTGTNAQETVQ
jgi:hypothetical protein